MDLADNIYSKYHRHGLCDDQLTLGQGGGLAAVRQDARGGRRAVPAEAAVIVVVVAGRGRRAADATVIVVVIVEELGQAKHGSKGLASALMRNCVSFRTTFIAQIGTLNTLTVCRLKREDFNLTLEAFPSN